ncbi:MAG TPA: neutral zinc metallopeptidase, partial [Myxococcota bacterium]|nr:neutral zinc metallopeptidase [Myxococcota bacterium]
AYVIAHEVGHHVQQLAGVSDKVRAAQRRGSKAEANALSIRMELQADCYAGLWAHHAQNRLAFLEDGDVEEALTAAAAIGDDTLQRQAGGRVAPETWTHGSSADRVRWFRTGMRDGTLAACDTF